MDQQSTLEFFEDNPDIRIVLFKNADHYALWQLFKVYPNLLQEPYVLEIIREANHLPATRITFKKNRKVVTPTVQSFEDLIFELRLRDREARKESCLSTREMLMIAISEEDMNLIDDIKLCDVSSSSDWEVGRLLGQIGNERMIDSFLKDYPMLQIEILSGLIMSSHNNTFWKLLGDLDIHEYSFQSSAIIGNNLEIYQAAESSEFYQDLLSLAGEYNSQEIIEYMKKNVLFDELSNFELFLGYIGGGHLNEAKETYKLLSDKSDVPDALLWAIRSNSLETLIYAEDLYHEITGRNLGSDDLVIDVLDGVVDFDDTVFYFLDKYPKCISYLWQNLLNVPWSLKKVILFFERYDPTFSRAETVLIKMVEKNVNSPLFFNECVIRWLENHVKKSC